MGLTSALQIGRSGLLTAQTALQVTGNNLANVATKGYHRQRVSTVPALHREIAQGIFVGTGVQLDAVTRVVDEALEARLRNAISDESGSLARQDLLRQVESIQAELSDTSLSSKLSAFFNAWSNLADNPDDTSFRTLVLQEGKTLSDDLRNLRNQLTTQRTQVDRAADNAAAQVDSLLTQIEQVNRQITTNEHGTGGAAGLRDQRDQLLGELSKFLEVSTVEQDNGAVDVFVGSLPIVLNGRSRGVELRRQTEDGQTQIELTNAADGSPLELTGGELAELVRFRQEDLSEAIDTLDTLAHQLIWQVNRLHSQGRGTEAFTTLTGSAQVADSAAALHDPDAGLDFTPTHGSFVVHVTEVGGGTAGNTTSTKIRVDLDPDNATADTTLAGLVADLDALDNVSASVTPDGRLRLDADSSQFRFSFSDDTSGVLAALGLNTYFTGTDARDVDVNDTVLQDPKRLAAGRLADDYQTIRPEDNALAIAGLASRPIDELNGFSLSGYWNRHVEEYAVRLAKAQERVTADSVVRESLAAQQQSISGVNADEETINLIQHQRAYQASARFLSVVDEMMQTLLGLV